MKNIKEIYYGENFIIDAEETVCEYKKIQKRCGTLLLLAIGFLIEKFGIKPCNVQNKSGFVTTKLY